MGLPSLATSWSPSFYSAIRPAEILCGRNRRRSLSIPSVITKCSSAPALHRVCRSIYLLPEKAAGWKYRSLARSPLPVSLLSSVPYALKAADSATLGGLPASAFMLAGSKTASGASSALVAASVSPDATSNVTTTGGTSKYLPKFTGANTVVDSQIYDNGTNVGIGDVPNASAKLDINGGVIMRGGMTVSRTGNATSSQGYPSYGFGFYSNAYNSSTHGTDNPHFILQSEPTGNNSSSTGATFNLLYADNGTAAETGLYINHNGTFHFASGQTFPGTGSGSITGVTAGTDLTGGGTSGTVTLNLDRSTIITKVAPGVALTGGGTTGTVTLNVDTTQIPTLTDHPVFSSSVAPAITGNGTSGEVGVYGSSDTLYGGEFSSGYLGVYGFSTDSSGGYGFYGYAQGTDSEGAFLESSGAGGYGVFGYEPGGPDSDGDPAVGVFGEVGAGRGVEGYTYEDSGIGVLGVSDGDSTTGSGYLTNDNATAGVFADTAASYVGTPSYGALVAFADDNHSGFMVNNSDSYTTLELINNGTAGTDVASAGVLEARTRYGSCAIGGKGDVTCTGQMKTLATTSSAHKVETYAMQSPENWMEDFGSASLSGGKATVSIDAAFAETANTGTDYHVFLTPNGDSKGLYVIAKSATSFEVRESGGGSASLSFDYRIVAKRKGYEAQRLVDVTERFQADAAREEEKARFVSAQRAGKPAIQLKPRAIKKQPAVHPVATTRSRVHTGE